MNKKLLLQAVFILCAFTCCSQKENGSKELTWQPETLPINKELKILKEAYPDCEFTSTYDKSLDDWIISVTSYNKTSVLYWCKGKYLPENQIKNHEKFWPVITKYNKNILDPAKMSEEQIQRIRNFGSDEQRKNGKVSSKYLFAAIYDAQTRGSTEKYLTSITFLNKKLNVHKAIVPKLYEVEKKITHAAKYDKQVQEFIDTLSTAGGYNWREIRDVNTRSFHSFGIAVDLLPVKWTTKTIYWYNEKRDGNKDWMLIPLEQRWMPPQAVIQAFESEGFIWGGKWAVWDNMHFEYHPEQIATM